MFSLKKRGSIASSIIERTLEAKIDSFVSIWGDTLVYGGIPIAILIVIFLHPHILRKGSRFIIQKKMPFIQLME